MLHKCRILRLCLLELISQNQPAMEQCFSLTTNQHQHQPKVQPAEQSLSRSRPELKDGISASIVVALDGVNNWLHQFEVLRALVDED
jgi:hypothetical protein